MPPLAIRIVPGLPHLDLPEADGVLPGPRFDVLVQGEDLPPFLLAITGAHRMISVNPLGRWGWVVFVATLYEAEGATSQRHGVFNHHTPSGKYVGDAAIQFSEDPRKSARRMRDCSILDAVRSRPSCHLSPSDERGVDIRCNVDGI
jgi:hypothetical protein